MTETLTMFQQRTAFVRDSLPRDGGFATNPRLTDKVDQDGRFRPFFGDTVIFDLTEDEKAWLAGIRQGLCEACGALLAEPLDPASFHITLHDLNSAADPQVIAPAMALAEERSRLLLASLPGGWAAHVRPTAVFSMVGTSVVLGFEPVDEENCAALMGLYEAFQQVVPLGYALTPHVTLAYYRPTEGGEDALRRLRAAIAAANQGMAGRTIALRDPRYCTFTDMNHYHFHGL